MSGKKTPDLDAAYGLDGEAANRRLYADWADSYDRGFAADNGYELHVHVAQRFAQLRGRGPVLDLGAGTGLCGASLVRLGMTQIHGTDLSPEMLKAARAKGVYDKLFEGNLLARLPVRDGDYKGVVSSGTFTHGHVGPDALGEVLRCLAPGGLAVLSINSEHWQAKGFATAFDGLSENIRELTMPEVRIYSTRASGPHAKDTAYLVGFRKV